MGPPRSPTGNPLATRSQRMVAPARSARIRRFGASTKAIPCSREGEANPLREEGPRTPRPGTSSRVGPPTARAGRGEGERAGLRLAKVGLLVLGSLALGRTSALALGLPEAHTQRRTFTIRFEKLMIYVVGFRTGFRSLKHHDRNMNSCKQDVRLCVYTSAAR